MRLVFDLQGAQGDSRHRGIGRYVLALAEAMAQAPGAHQLVIALNGGLVEATADLRDRFKAYPGIEVATWYGPGDQNAARTENAARRAAAEHIRAAFLHACKPDLLLVGSLFEGYGDDAVTAFPPGLLPPPMAAICYDLIPLSQPELYLPSPQMQDWYYARLLQMGHLDGLLCISRSSREEALGSLPIAPSCMIDIQAGVAPQFRPAREGDEPPSQVAARYGLKPGYILCVGAVEARKNLTGLIRGYALLLPALRAQHRLVATGWNDRTQLPALRQLAAECGLAEGELHLLADFIPEADLPGLYRASALTVCASLHEGFGLTVAESMACGTPTICSDVSSLPEVMDHPQALFDPRDPASIAARLQDVLESSALRDELSRYGLSRAGRFSWAHTAARAWRGLETIAAQITTPHPSTLGRRKPRLGVVGTPAATATNLNALLLALARWYELIFIANTTPADPRLRASSTLAAPAGLPGLACARMIYLPPEAPNEAVQMLSLLDAYPGIVLTGSQSFTTLMQNALGSDADHIYTVLMDLYGWHAVLALWRSGDLSNYPVDDALAQRAVALIALSDFDDVSGTNAADKAAADLHDRMEAAYAASPAAAMDRCLADLGDAKLAIPAAARAVAASFRPRGRRTLFVDVSKIVEFDGGTGIQRVVRETVLQLGHAEDLPARLEPVQGIAGTLHLARAFGQRLFGVPRFDPQPTEAPAAPTEGDVFIGLDLNMHDVAGLATTIRTVRAHGARAYVVVYDLLPVLLPDFFPATVQSMYPFWLRTISELADGLVCISRGVADELIAWLDAYPPPRARPLQIGWFHLGHDFRPVTPTAAAPTAQTQAHPCLAASAARPTLLMVGTLEPRKGHTDALDALDLLWAQGVDVGLTLVGKTGWMMEPLEQRLRAHPEMGRRLNWIVDASDALVADLYRSCGALLMASQGEGFGLPLVEAARAGLALITRDLPVFREICGDHALYFSGGPAAMADCVRQWLALRGTGEVPDPLCVLSVSWKDSSRQLAQITLNDDWYATWTPPIRTAR
jgi:glycosyltransferase involved in cell wall biosynthesis